MKVLAVDVGGERHLLKLEPPTWTLKPLNEHGEKIFLEEIVFVAAECEEIVERPLEDVLEDIAGEGPE